MKRSLILATAMGVTALLWVADAQAQLPDPGMEFAPQLRTVPGAAGEVRELGKVSERLGSSSIRFCQGG